MKNQMKSMDEIEAELRSRGAIIHFDDDCDEEVRASFLAHVLACEDEEATITVREHLVARGKEVATELWPLIAQFAELHIVLERTDHLDDAALLRKLNEFLDEQVYVADDPLSVVHLDLIGSGSEEDITLMLRYYATDEDRRDWQRDFPDYAMPARERLPFDRDRFLPKAEELRAMAR